MRRILFAFCLVFGLVQHALAQTYPNKPVTIIVPYGAGGGTDLFARTLANALGPKLGVAVVVENVPGAGGTIGVQKLNNAPPDGYTLIVASGLEFEMQSLANPDRPARATELKSIGNFGTQAMVLVVRPGLGVKTVDEFIALAKTKPGNLSLAASGLVLQITGLMIQQAAGIELIDVNYRSAPAILNDILGGTIDAAVMTLPIVNALIKEGKLVALGVSEAKRSALLPGVPSLSETPALRGIDTKIIYPLFGPKGLPQSIANVISKSANEVLIEPQFQQALMNMQVAPAMRVSEEDADATKVSQLAAFKKALAGPTSKYKQTR